MRKFFFSFLVIVVLPLGRVMRSFGGISSDGGVLFLGNDVLSDIDCSGTLIGPFIWLVCDSVYYFPQRMLCKVASVLVKEVSLFCVEYTIVLYVRFDEHSRRN